MRTLVALLACCVAMACAEERTASPAATGRAEQGRTLDVYATSYPLAYFAERIAGDAADVVFAVPPGVDPAHWNPDAAEIARAGRADLLLRHGVGDPEWLALSSLHRDRVVDTTARVRDRRIDRETVRHQHGPDGDHSHGAWSGTPWLDPNLAAAQAEAVAEALAARRPEQAERFRERLSSLIRDLEDLDDAQARAARRIGDTPLLFSHPVYDYLEARYALNGRSVVWEPDAVPSDAQWRALGELRREHPARTMLWEAEPLPEIAERLARLGVESVVYAPCSNRPAAGAGTEDWLAVMRGNLAALESLAARTQ